ncbi:hypothetical protein LOK49_LG01G03112 [Camellia lanceoleosa]|uniref:Uncharacterized protein n=1 Tax=Camellia lanceoleosa TaxID=1840588 RepID=A0ACC0IZE4_9ERIC|nr:hypothetical protein LOK49_LG01G03112 [Camellia lanceoleosa]
MNKPMATYNGRSNKTEMARRHIEEIRKRKYSIGKKVPNPLTQDLHNANAEDNEYSPGVEPALEFVLTNVDITELGSLATLLVFNNEVGFAKDNIESLCSIGRSTKRYHEHKGFIGEKAEANTVGIFVFLPTTLVTNFPFVVQADFILASSREAILLDNKWNLGILEHVPSICIKLFPITHVLEFLPVQWSPLQWLNGVRDSIRIMVKWKSIVPCEKFLTGEMVFFKPTDVVRILPQFRKIQSHIKQLGDISSQGKFVLHNTLDDKKYNGILNFLGVPSMNDSCDCWNNLLLFPPKIVNKIPLLKYIAWKGQVLPCNVLQMKREPLKVHLVWQAPQHSWLNKWNVEMRCPNNMFFFPDATVSAILQHEKKETLTNWLKSKVGVVVTDVSMYCYGLGNFLSKRKDPKLAVSLAHLVYHSSMPVVDACLNVSLCTSFLVPTSRSIWVKLFGSSKIFPEELELENNEMIEEYDDSYPTNKEDEAYSCQKYVELGEVYGEAAEFAGECTPENELLNFLIKHAKVTDLRHILPQDSIRYSLQSTNNLNKYEIPVKFIESIQCGKWMKTYSGFTESSTLLEIGKAFTVLSAIDEEYYKYKIRSFKDELMFIGVQIGTENMNQLIIDHLKPLVSSEMSGHLGFSMLSFIRYSNDNNKLDVDLLKTLQVGKWLKKNQGYVTPRGAVYLASDIGEAILQITDLWVIDKTYYGSQLSGFVHELKLIGIIVHPEDVYKLIPEHFKFPKDLSKLTKDVVFLLLECIQHLGPAVVDLTKKITYQPWMKTSFDFRCPSECLLPDKNWGYLVDVVPLPIIDEVYYGSKVQSYKAELEAIGVAVNPDQVCNMIITKVKLLLSSSGLTGAIGEKWLKTCHGYRFASGSILFDPKWGTVSQFVDVPLIDDACYGNKIFSFKDELKMMGVMVNFNEVAHFVARGLKLPQEPVSVTADCTSSLLHCAKSLRHSTKLSDQSLLEHLLNKLKGSKWLKTHMGYRTPNKSHMFNPEWNSCLEEQDGPLIDQGFYGTSNSLERDELKAIGVKTDTKDIALQFSNTSGVRIHRVIVLTIVDFRSTRNQRKWVNSCVCVLHDRDNLFGSFFHNLDGYYEKELLSFMSTTFGADTFPTLSRYVSLWNNWERRNYHVCSGELDSFWGHISESVTMLPGAMNISGTVKLVEKDEIFIPDDLQLKKSFRQASLSSLTKLYEIYRSFGVQNISESVQFSVNCEFEKPGLEASLIGKPLIKIVLAFPVNPVVNMPVEKKDRPMIITYSLHLPFSKKSLHVEIRKLVLWDKNLQRLLVHKPSWKGEWKNIELITNFSRAISEAVLPDATGLANDLCKMIKMGFAFGFTEDEVDSLLVSENLELYAVDTNFLECAFPAVKASSPVLVKPRFLSSEYPLTPATSFHKKPRTSLHKNQ